MLVQSAVHLVNVLVLPDPFNLLDADHDSGVFTWASSAATFAGALGLVLLALAWGAHRRLLLALAATLSYFSLDDSLALHERVAVAGDGAFGIDRFGMLLWPLVFMPLFAFAAAGLWAVATAMRPEAARVLRVGLGLLVLAIGLEMSLGLVLGDGQGTGDLGYQSEAVLEEGAELAGWTLIATALASTLVRGIAATGPGFRAQGEAARRARRGRARAPEAPRA